MYMYKIKVMRELSCMCWSLSFVLGCSKRDLRFYFTAYASPTAKRHAMPP